MKLSSLASSSEGNCIYVGTKKTNVLVDCGVSAKRIENSLSELWSIFDFIMPGYLFKYRRFKESFETPIVKEESEASLERLKKMIEPFVLIFSL